MKLGKNKVCSKCFETKPLSCFYKDKSKQDGLRPDCKQCVNERIVRDPQKAREYWASYYGDHRDELLNKKRVYHAENMDRVSERSKKWRKNNPSSVKDASVRHRMRRKKAIPPWANLKLIDLFYAQARYKSDLTGVPHEVDHIIPVSGKTVCGLHCEQNMRVITSEENKHKSNRWPS